MSTIRPFAYTVIADSIGPEDESAAVDDQRATMQIQIDVTKNPWITRADIYGGILGFPIYVPGTGGIFTGTGAYIRRVMPWRHPTVRWLWATQISSMQGRKWVSKNFAPVSSSAAYVRNEAGGGLYSAYKYLRMNVLFTCPPYDVLADNQVQAGTNLFAEALRFNEEEFEFSQELITRKGTYYIWSDLTEQNNAGDVVRFQHGLENQNVDIGLTIRAAKGILMRKWYQVPRWGLFGSTGRGRPFLLMDGIGKINQNPFSLTRLGPPANRLPTQYDKGTLLCLPPKLIRTTSPVPNSYMYPSWQTNNRIQVGNLNIDIDDLPPRTYNIEQRWLFFDPPTEPNYPIRGHNLVPIPNSRSVGILGFQIPTPTLNPNFYMVSLREPQGQAAVTGAAHAINRGIYTHYPFEYFYQVY